MGPGRIRLLRKFPGPKNDLGIYHEFCAKGEGYVVAMDAARLSALASMRPTESDIELIQFGKLVAVYARHAGQDPFLLATTSHFEAAIALHVQDVPFDSPFYASRNFAGLHRRLAETIKELSAWGFEPDSLDALGEEVDGPLGAKLVPLAKVQKSVEETLAELGRNLNHHHIQLCFSSEPEEDVVFPPALIFLGSELEPKHVEWLKWAASVGGDLTIVVDSSPSDPTMFPTADLLANHLGVASEFVGDRKRLVESLFMGTVPEQPGLEVSAFRAADPLAEIEWALRGCLAKAEYGFPNLGIFVRNLEDYAPLIESAAQRLSIPVSLSRKAVLNSNGFVRALTGMVKALASRDVRDLRISLRSTYLGLNQAVRKEISDALSTAHREGDAQWSSFAAWAKTKEEEILWLLQILAWRDTVLAESAPLGIWRGRLSDLIAILPWITQSSYALERDIRAKTVLESEISAIASIQNLNSPNPLNLGEFLGVIEGIVANANSTVETQAKGVQISNSAHGFGAVDHLFVLGMLEGSFPRRRSEDPILTDEDRYEISHRRSLLFPLPDSFAKAKKERDEFVGVCAVPNQSITFSYPETSDDRDTIPAFYLKEVERATGRELIWTHHPRRQLAPLAESAVALNDQMLREALDSDPTSPIELLPLQEEAKEKISAGIPSSLSLRELRTAFECPFRHFAEQRLRLYPERDRRRWYQLRMVPQKARLALQPTESDARQALNALLDTELDEMKAHVSPWELRLLKQGGKRLVEEWITREFKARENWSKDPGSTKVGVTFGSDELRGELPRVGAVSGGVASVSRMGDYKVVQMVESNTPKAEKDAITGLKDRDTLYYGGHLLAAYEKGSTPALEVESMSGGRKLVLMKRLPEPQVPASVEDGLEVLDLSGGTDSSAVTEVFFQRVKELLKQSGDAIKSLDIRATKGDHCEFCDYGELCRNSQVFGESDSPFGEDED